MSRLTKKSFAVFAVMAMCCSILQAGPLRRMGDAGRSLLGDGSGADGTVMAFAKAGNGSGQTAVLVLDTVLQKSLQCYLVPANDQRRFHRKIEVGSTFKVISFLSGSLKIGEIDCAKVDKWDPDKKGAADRREFLTGERGFLGPVIVYAMRGQPKAAEHFFPGGVAFAGVAHNLPDVVKTLLHFGYDLSATRDAIDRGGAMKDDPSEIAQCRSALETARDALAGMAPVAESISREGEDHHGEVEPFLFAMRSAMQADQFFRSHPDGNELTE